MTNNQQSTPLASRYIDTPAELEEFVARVKGKDWLALDTEFLRERTYYPLLCLIQIAVDDEIVCIDPIALDDLTPLSVILSNPQQVKIIHSCSQDLEALARRFDTPVNNIADTQLAAEFIGLGDQKAYAALVEDICQITLDKAHTRADWSARPLSAKQVEYAEDDVRYLGDVHGYLQAELIKLGRDDWYQQESQARGGSYQDLNPDEAWHRLKGVDRLDDQQQVRAFHLARWRERQAQDKDLPREWVVASKALLELAKVPYPRSLNLTEIEGLSPKLFNRHKKALIECLRQADTEPSQGQGGQRQSHEVKEQLTSEQKAQVNSLMKSLKQIAENNQISQSLIANRKMVARLVQGDRSLPLLEGWRYRLAGERLVGLISGA